VSIARQARCLDGNYGSNKARADCRQQSIEARSGDTTGGHAEVVVDDDDFRKAKRARTIGQTILTTAALMVVAQLIGSGLPDVHVSVKRQMISGEFGHDFPLRGALVSAGCVPLPRAVEPVTPRLRLGMDLI